MRAIDVVANHLAIPINHLVYFDFWQLFNIIVEFFKLLLGCQLLSYLVCVILLIDFST